MGSRIAERAAGSREVSFLKEIADWTRGSRS